MSRQISRKNVGMLVIGVVSILGLFAYTWVHSGNLLATYIDPPWIGFVAAAGIELSIIGLSMRIGELKKAGLSTRYFWFTLIAVVAVSAAANIAEGFYVRYHEMLTISNVQRLDLVEAAILVGATGLISLVTLALSEIIGQDVTSVEKAHGKTSKADRPLDGGYEIVKDAAPQIEAPAPQLAAPKEETATDEEFKRRMDEMGDSAPKSINEVMVIFNLSHATAQRRLAKYRGTK
jgi:hypothetical protein